MAFAAVSASWSGDDFERLGFRSDAIAADAGEALASCCTA
jgi:hypothetical protein